MSTGIITIDQLPPSTVLTKNDWLAISIDANKQTKKSTFTQLIELLKGDFYTKAEILVLLKAAQTGGAFDWNRPITQGAYAGITPGGVSIAEGLENLFYAPQSPLAQLSVDNALRQFGAPTDAVLHYNTIVRTNPITQIVVDGNTVTKSSDTIATSVSANTDKTFHMSVTDGKLASTADATVFFRHKRYWFVYQEDLLSLSDADASKVIQTMQSEFAFEYSGTLTRAQSRTKGGAFNPHDEYIYFVWQADFGFATFISNGLGDTDFIQKRFNYTNSDNYTSEFIIVRKKIKLSNTFEIIVN